VRQRYERETLQLRVARVEDELREPTRPPSAFSDDELLVFVRVGRALHYEFHVIAQVCIPPHKRPYPQLGEDEGAEAAPEEPT